MSRWWVAASDLSIDPIAGNFVGIHLEDLLIERHSSRVAWRKIERNDALSVVVVSLSRREERREFTPGELSLGDARIHDDDEWT